MPPIFAQAVTLPQISDYLAGSEAVFPQCDEAKVIAETMIHRAARIAAILTAGGVVRSCGRSGHCKIAVEGSQFRRLTGFGSCFTQELEQLLGNYGITCALVEVENSCLVGAALAAFAQGM